MRYLNYIGNGNVSKIDITPNKVGLTHNRLGLSPSFSGELMKIMTQADKLKGKVSRQYMAHLADEIIRNNVTLIALHNIAQSSCMEPVPEEYLDGRFSKDAEAEIRMDNAAALLAHCLRQRGKMTSWVWIPHSREMSGVVSGTAFLSIGSSIRCIDRFSIPDSVPNTVVGIQVEQQDDWFYCLSMESWDNPRCGFLVQWRVLNCCIASKRLCGTVWLLGDFGITDSTNPESCRQMLAGGWKYAGHEIAPNYNVWYSA